MSALAKHRLLAELPSITGARFLPASHAGAEDQVLSTSHTPLLHFASGAFR